MKKITKLLLIAIGIDILIIIALTISVKKGLIPPSIESLAYEMH